MQAIDFRCMTDLYRRIRNPIQNVGAIKQKVKKYGTKLVI